MSEDDAQWKRTPLWMAAGWTLVAYMAEGGMSWLGFLFSVFYLGVYFGVLHAKARLSLELAYVDDDLRTMRRKRNRWRTRAEMLEAERDRWRNQADTLGGGQ